VLDTVWFAMGPGLTLNWTVEREGPATKTASFELLLQRSRDGVGQFPVTGMVRRPGGQAEDLGRKLFYSMIARAQ